MSVFHCRLLCIRPVSGGRRLGHGEGLPSEEQTKSSGCWTAHSQSHPHRGTPPQVTGVDRVRHRPLYNTLVHYCDGFSSLLCVFLCVSYRRIRCGHQCTPRPCGGMRWVWDWCLRQTCSPPCTSPTGCSRESVYASTRTKDSPQPHWAGLLSHSVFRHVD